MKLEQNDRISYSLGVANKEYGTGFDVHVSYTTDIKTEETIEVAFKRAQLIVETQIKQKIRKYKKLQLK